MALGCTGTSDVFLGYSINSNAGFRLGYFSALNWHKSQEEFYAAMFKGKKKTQQQTPLSALLEITADNIPLSAVYLTT